MAPERLEHLLSLVGPKIAKKQCKSRNPIPPEERLVLTLRYLATGDSQQTQSFAFRIGRATVSNISKETCAALWEALNETYLRVPSTVQEWFEIAKEFKEEWQYPNCIGALDGKHISIECPQRAGSAYFNYKKFHSIVLLAVCDAKYCFIMVDIGAFGGENDASVFSNSHFGRALEYSPTSMGIPRPTSEGDRILPYVLVADDIFPLKPYLMKPYPGKRIKEEHCIFNYRLSRARRTIENTFGVLAAKWRIFRRPIKVAIQQVEGLTKAAVCLHNYLRLTDNANCLPTGFVDSEDSTGKIIPGDWRSVVNGDKCLHNLGRLHGNRYSFEADEVRENFNNFFMSPDGEVNWQYKHVRSWGTVHD